MRRHTDWIVEDERARKEFEEDRNVKISYGHFRALYPELVPSMHKRSLHTIRTCRNYDAPHRKGGTFQVQLTKDDDIEMASLFKSGTKEPELAKHFGVSIPTIRSHLKRMNMYPMIKTAAKLWTEDEVEELRMLYLQDFSVSDIAEKLNRTNNAIRMKLISTGIKKVKKKMKKPL